MGLDTHMLAGSRACSTSTLAHSLTITNQTNQHFAETLLSGAAQRPPISADQTRH